MAARINWTHDTDSSGRERSFSCNIWPFWVVIWEHEGEWRWQHMPHPSEKGVYHVGADRFACMDAAQVWFDAAIEALTTGDSRVLSWADLRLAEPAPARR